MLSAEFSDYLYYRPFHENLVECVAIQAQRRIYAGFTKWG